MIVVVEDHDDTRKALVDFLEFHELATASTGLGEEALGMMNVLRPYAVILDWHLPDKSGLEVLREMKNNSSLREIPVVFYTADSDRILKAEALEAGAQSVFVKGSDWSDLVSELGDLTSTRPELLQRSSG